MGVIYTNTLQFLMGINKTSRKFSSTCTYAYNHYRLLGGWSCPVPNVFKLVTATKTSREAEIETDFPVDTLNDPMYQEFGGFTGPLMSLKAIQLRADVSGGMGGGIL